MALPSRPSIESVPSNGSALPRSARATLTTTAPLPAAASKKRPSRLSV
jgi:hypothetical protein